MRARRSGGVLDDLSDQNRPPYDYGSPADGRAFDAVPMLPRLMATEAFKRLREIRFLGGIDYLLVRNPNGSKGRYTRHQHSLGVTRLALRYAAMRELPPVERDLAAVAALLHDVGHAPLSHSLEPVFVERFGLDHHTATADVITGRAPVGRQVYAVLRGHGVDVERLLAVISGADPGFEGFFGGPINFDTIEGILRSQSYAPSHSLLPNPETVMEAAVFRDGDIHRQSVDGFWLHKDQVYRSVINSRSGVFADHACQVYMRRHIGAFTTEDYYSTEDAVFRKLPGLKRLLTERSFEILVARELDGPLRHRARRFFIDEAVDFRSRMDKDRYLQRKEDRVLLPGPTRPLDAQLLERDLFDDGIRPEQGVLGSAPRTA